MVQHMVVPVDGSDASWRAVDVAVQLGRRVDADLEIVEVVFDSPDAPAARARVEERLQQHDTTGVTATAAVRVAERSVAATVADIVGRRPESTVVMASHGRGRSAALLGSVAEEVLQLIFGPILVVGPHVEHGDLEGPVIVTVDGSVESESALPLAAAWAIELADEPWVVEVVEPDLAEVREVGESAYPARLARALSHECGHPVQFEVLHGRSVHDEIADFARQIDASLVVAATHGRTGMSRFVIGSTAAAIVRHAPCPVLLARPPHLRDD